MLTMSHSSFYLLEQAESQEEQAQENLRNAEWAYFGINMARKAHKETVDVVKQKFELWKQDWKEAERRMKLQDSCNTVCQEVLGVMKQDRYFRLENRILNCILGTKWTHLNKSIQTSTAPLHQTSLEKDLGMGCSNEIELSVLEGAA